MRFNSVGVVGGGTMGAGIAEVVARAGAAVTVREVDEASIERAQQRITGSLQRAAKAGRLTDVELADVTGRISYTLSLEEVAQSALVVEAAPEIEELKLQVFRDLDQLAPAETILASNTSSIPLVKMAAVTKRQQQVVGVHFFNPVPVMPLIEIVESLLTSPETLESVTSFAEADLGKHTIRSKDRAGFVVNALLIPYLLSAIRMMESGFASATDIDAGMVKGCGHPMGPLALADLIGLDTTAAVAQSMYEEFKEQLFAPPPLLLRMCEAGLLGRKTGQGFFTY